MNIRDIADAIATNIGTLTVNGETATATALLPNTISRVALLVYPPSGDFDPIGPSQWRQGTLVYPVRLLRDPLDVPGRTDALYDWHAAMWDRVETNVDLNLSGYVTTAESQSVRIAIDGERYAGGLFDVVEIGVLVGIHERVTALAL